MGLGTRKGIYAACPHRNRGKLCSSNPQPPCSWVGAGRGNPQSFGPPPNPPPSRSADFQPVPGTPQVLYTTPFLTSPHRVCGDRHPGNGVEAVGQGKLSPTTAALGGSSPTPCMLIPRAPQSYHLRLCTHSVLSEMFQGVGGLGFLTIPSSSTGLGNIVTDL